MLSQEQIEKMSETFMEYVKEHRTAENIDDARWVNEGLLLTTEGLAIFFGYQDKLKEFIEIIQNGKSVYALTIHLAQKYETTIIPVLFRKIRPEIRNSLKTQFNMCFTICSSDHIDLIMRGERLVIKVKKHVYN